MTQILIFSGFVILAGIVLFRKAIKGKLVSDHPHCRSCKFDLLGLELDRYNVCPDCGQPTIPDTPMVLHGLHKRRTIMAMLAITLIFSGCLGIAWPKVSQLPAIKNIDWYAKFPESVLLKLESGGDKNALQTINDRVVDGSLSTEGFSIMIERAFANEADSTVEWDKRWGEILYQGCVQGIMSDDQVDTYITSYLDVQYTIHDFVAQRSDGIAAKEYESFGRNRYPATVGGPTGYSIQSTLMSWGIDTVKPYFERLNKYHSPREVHVSTMGGSYGSSSGTMRIRPRRSRWLELERGTTVQAYIEYEVDIFTADTQVLVSSHRNRVEHDVQVVSKLLSHSVKPELVPGIASKLQCFQINIPRDPVQAKGYKRIADYEPALVRIQIQGADIDAGLLGTIWFNNGIREIKLNEIKLNNLKKSTQYGIRTDFKFGENGQSWLDYFIEDQPFWDQVVQDQQITIIYRADSSLLEKYPFTDYIVDTDIVWRDVPVNVLSVGKQNVQRNGVITQEWRLVNEAEIDATGTQSGRSDEPVVGEILE